jgi:cytochrome c oxidase subunit 4
MKYAAIAVVLSVVTAIEVAIVYMGFLGSLIVPLLVILSAGKFTLVVMFFMHLKFDNRLLSALFVGGLLLAMGVLTALLVLFGVIGG